MPAAAAQHFESVRQHSPKSNTQFDPKLARHAIADKLEYLKIG